ncbi:nucleotide-diphospho-sugar transferase [Podospora didyma]|uniref:Nucleotide-diphospho-sugar transferase n=1 Tax=Podospora didyma TaxID=330526 RepID=A0AAE0NUJ0_9PEZI|nr:nucleotide-diphospho-sugar transferase [Podospora didyma]
MGSITPPADHGTGKVWASLITRMDYLPGLLTLDYSLKRAGTRYPLVALYTDNFPEKGLRALSERGIPAQLVDRLDPPVKKDFVNDARFNDTWTKLAAFGLTEYNRVVLLDSDMLVLRNMDELMDIELDDDVGEDGGEEGSRVFAASHACVCNPLKRAHYPNDWVPENCAFTAQHDDPDSAQHRGSTPHAGVGMPNSGLLVLNPSQASYNAILAGLASPKTLEYNFPDQELLGDVFKGRWVGLPYVYNALKPMRWLGVHDAIWRDGRVKNVHYILSPKPWNMKGVDPHHPDQEPLRWWRTMNEERIRDEERVRVQVSRI